MQRIGASLARAGYGVLLVGRRQTRSRPLTAREYGQHRLTCFFARGKLFYLEYNLRLSFFLLFRSFDAYVAVDLDTGLPLFWKAYLTRKVFVYDAHEYFPEMAEVVPRPLVKKIWTKLEQFLVPRTRFAYTVSQSLAERFERLYGVPFTVVRNCPWLNPAQSAEQPEAVEPVAKFLLYQGAVNAGRGLEVLLRAMPALNLPLVICGEGDVLEQLRQLSRDLRITDKVIFKGYVLPAELECLTRQAYLGLNLLQDQGLSYYYSLGNKFFDYLHAGVPQLLVDFPEYTRLNNQYQVGRVVALTPDALVAAVRDCLAHPAYYEQLRQNCRQARLTLNWQNEEPRLLAFYQQLWRHP